MVNMLDDRSVHRSYKQVSKEFWMPEFWALLSCCGGEPTNKESRKEQRKHFWNWYLDTGIVLALDTECSTKDPRYSGPFFRPFTIGKILLLENDGQEVIRTPYFDGYLERKLDAEDQLTSLDFIYRSNCSHSLHTDFQQQTGTWSDKSFASEFFNKGQVEVSHLGHSGPVQYHVLMSDWVCKMEHRLLFSVAMKRFRRIFRWAKENWESPIRLDLHQEEFRNCLASYTYLFERTHSSVETSNADIQLGWAVCALVLGVQKERAKSIFVESWESRREKYRDEQEMIQHFVGTLDVEFLYEIMPHRKFIR